MDVDRICQPIEVDKADGRSPHLLVPLLGRFKGEDGDRMQLFPITNKIRYGFHIHLWAERLVKIFKVKGKQNCPAFCDKHGFQIYTAVLESVINYILGIMQRYKHHKDDIAKELVVELWIRLSIYPRKLSLNK